jgi:hypothetical protein
MASIVSYDVFCTALTAAVENTENNKKGDKEEQIKKIIEIERIDLKIPNSEKIIEDLKSDLRVIKVHLPTAAEKEEIFKKKNKAWEERIISMEEELVGLPETIKLLEDNLKKEYSPDELITVLDSLKKEQENKLSGLDKNEKEPALLISAIIKKLNRQIERINDYKLETKRLETRADFDLTGNESLINTYLPFRETLTKDPERLAKYEKLKQLLFESIKSGKLKINTTSDYLIEAWKQPKEQKELTASGQMVAIDYLNKIFFDNPEYLEKALSLEKKLQICLQPGGEFDIQYNYSSFNNILSINYKNVFSNNKYLRLPLNFLFTVTKDPNIFNKHLPYRRSILNNKEKLEEYDKNLQDILDKKIKFLPEYKTINGVVKYNEDDLQEADECTKYIIALAIAEYSCRTDELNKVFEYRNGFKILASNGETGDRKNVAGVYLGKENQNTVIITLSMVAESLIKTIIHEMAHAIDGADKSQVGTRMGNPYLDKDLGALSLILGNDRNTDGIFGNMTEKEKADFEEGREELFYKLEKFIAAGDRQEILRNSQSTPHVEVPGIGMSYYAFNNEVEFIAEASSMFFKNPDLLKKSSPKIYSAFVSFFKFDPLKKEEEKPQEKKVENKTSFNIRNTKNSLKFINAA